EDRMERSRARVVLGTRPRASPRRRALTALPRTRYLRHRRSDAAHRRARADRGVRRAARESHDVPVAAGQPRDLARPDRRAYCRQMKRALFVISVFQFSRETFPVLERCASAGLDVHVLVGWTGDTAEAYIEQCASAGFTVHRPPADIRYGDPRAAAAPHNVEAEIAVA